MVDKPLYVVPHFVSAAVPRQRHKDSPFRVVVMADSRSSFSRKNPAGALAAFRMAFGTSLSAKLTLKLTGVAREIIDLEKSLGDLLGANVDLEKDFLTPAALATLYRRADVLLSLHRAEGFGLTMLEAMAFGMPVVATGWSGNLEFMDASNSRLVPYQLIPVEDASTVYRQSVWADPDVPAAAAALRHLATSPNEYARLSAAAYDCISKRAPSFPFSLPERASRPRVDVLA